MVGFHIQNSPPEWLHAVTGLRFGTPVKLVFGVERCREAKAANPNVKTWYRWVGEQPLPESNFEQHARQWLNQFVDGTFRREAQHVDFIQEYNETLANSQSAAERARWIQLHTAMAKVWQNEYRKEPQLAHIRMILCETAIGNDIPVEIAAAAVQYDALLGYHPYIVCRVAPVAQGALADEPVAIRHDAPRASFSGQELYKMQVTTSDQQYLPLASRPLISRPTYVSPHDWQWYSGRWVMMDAQFAGQGIRPDWAFGEMGPVLDASQDWSGWLDPHGGWKHKDCLNGDFDKYLTVLKYWLDNVMQTPAYAEGRVLGGTLFTSGAPGSGPAWDNFDVVQPQMDAVAEFGQSYDYSPTDPIDPQPPLEPGNKLANPSFEEGWTDLSITSQQPNSWRLTIVGQGVDVRGRPVSGSPECVHKHKTQLPPDEQPGAENALILDGDYVYKLFTSATWSARLDQAVGGLQAGKSVKLTVPINVHFDGRPQEADPEDTLIEVGVNQKSVNFWVRQEHDRIWQNLVVSTVVPDDAVANVWVKISVKWEHPTSVFLDALILEVMEQPVNEWQQEIWDKSIELQTVQLNPNAALQAAIFADGFVPVESEFWYVADGTEYAAQAAEHLGTGQRRVYYAIVPNWSDVRWFTN